MEFGIARAKIQNQSQFRGQRNLLFWGYLAGVAVHRLLTISSDTPWAIGLLSLAELAVFIVAFVRAKHNWLVIWAYLAGARALATLMWLAFWGAFGAPGVVILGSLVWFALVPVLLYWHNQIAVQQSLKSWIPTGSQSDW